MDLGRHAQATPTEPMPDTPDTASSDRLLEGLFKHSADGVLLTTPEGAILRANPSACRALGGDEATLRRLGRDRLLVDGPAVRALLRARAELGSVTGRVELRRVDGTTFPAELTSAIVPSADGPHAFSIFRDVSERERAAAALAESEALLRQLFDPIPDPLFMKDERSRWRMVNQATLAVVGRPLDEALGRSDTELFADRAAGEAMEANDRLVMSSGRAQVVEEQVLTPEGRRTFRSTKVPLRDAAGRVVGLVGHAQDVSDRARAEEHLGLQAAIEKLPIGVVVVEVRAEEGLIVLAGNAAYDRIVRGAPPPGTRLADLAHRLYLSDRRTPVPSDELPGSRAARLGEPVLGMELHLRRGDGTWRVVSMSAAPIGEPAPDRSRRAIAVLLDVTEQRTAVEAMQAARRALRVLAGTNEASLRAESEAALFQEVCRVTVEEGGFRMAWAGVAEAGEERIIRPVAWHGHEDGYLAGARLTWADVPHGRGPAGEAMRSGRVDVANDFATDPRMAPWREAALARGYASTAALPLVVRGRRLGLIVTYASEPGAFTPDVIEILQRVADDLAFGLDALRARARVEVQAAQLQVAVEVAEVGLLRWDLPGGAVSASEPLRRMAGFTPGERADRTEHWQARVHPDDLADVSRRFAGLFRRPGTPASAASSGRWRFRFLRPDGSACWVDARYRVLFDEAGVAHELFGAHRDVTPEVEERERLRALTARALSVRDEEKARIARDLHDDLGQVLTALQLELKAAEDLVERLGDAAAAGPVLDRVVAASELAGSTLRTVQRLSQELHPEVLTRLGLEAALRQELRRFGQRTGLEVALEVAGQAPPHGPAATALFRIAQEALTNVARHAGASRVRVALRGAAGEVTVEVADDGRGLTPAGPAQAHLGLLGMAERARALGGDVEVGPGPERGTVVRARIPTPDEA